MIVDPFIPFMIPVLVGYLIGCITVGYYLVWYRTQIDLREFGSTSVGATNAGRALGRKGFLLTFGGDLAKGTGAVLIGSVMGEGSAPVWGAAIGVTAGHIWPIQLRGRGGRGISPAIGAILAADPYIASMGLVGAILFYGVTRRFVISGLLVFFLTPLTLYFMGGEPIAIGALAVIAAMILIGHRDHLYPKSPVAVKTSGGEP